MCLLPKGVTNDIRKDNGLLQQFAGGFQWSPFKKRRQQHELASCVEQKADTPM